MFNKTIFKQTFKSNYKLWLIFTATLCAMLALIISRFDPIQINSMMDMVMSAFGDVLGDALSAIGPITLNNMLSGTFYGMLAIVLPVIFVVLTANGLIAAQVDKGSMAYTLSTPIKRRTVAATKATYLITAVLCMFLVVSLVGLAAVQVTQGNVFGDAYTADVKEVSKEFGWDKATVAGDLTIILENSAAVTRGAEARKIDEDVYKLYLQQKIGYNDDYDDGDNSQITMTPGEMMEFQQKFLAGVTAAADVLDTSVTGLTSNLAKIKNSAPALEAAAIAADLVPEETLALAPNAEVALEMQKAAFVGVINAQLVSKQFMLDEGLVFSVPDYLALNLGAVLLIFATSGIAFFCSCLFNSANNSLALGAGIPVAFYLFQMMSGFGEGLEFLKYFSMNTLYDPSAIVSGGSFWLRFLVLGIIGAVLYVLAVKIFKEKDLPL
ncbi:MAG: ABC transporter permease [Candidatus Bathyarchaeota archaeon]|uniref:ABC transporter permease subunit n=1 Tax=Candidatus Bathycorpusculum sp. TaxID=2994959 RepID=UPI00282D2BD7|nr:ABC transporter permease [Candidatus Termiticorpusculum sp.]MCL2257651.1 ABC transporter permease [Candidatus Termiticorpusculum sp.]MCL2292213.1 ABC transporter permease [Candidatus Termiticorpusculum sp.]